MNYYSNVLSSFLENRSWHQCTRMIFNFMVFFITSYEVKGSITRTGGINSVQKSFYGAGMTKYISRHLIVTEEIKAAEVNSFLNIFVSLDHNSNN